MEPSHLLVTSFPSVLYIIPTSSWALFLLEGLPLAHRDEWGFRLLLNNFGFRGAQRYHHAPDGCLFVCSSSHAALTSLLHPFTVILTITFPSRSFVVRLFIQLRDTLSFISVKKPALRTYTRKILIPDCWDADEALNLSEDVLNQRKCNSSPHYVNSSPLLQAVCISYKPGVSCLRYSLSSNLTHCAHQDIGLPPVLTPVVLRLGSSQMVLGTWLQFCMCYVPLQVVWKRGKNPVQSDVQCW